METELVVAEEKYETILKYHGEVVEMVPRRMYMRKASADAQEQEQMSVECQDSENRFEPRWCFWPGLAVPLVDQGLVLPSRGQWSGLFSDGLRLVLPSNAQ